MTQTQQLKEKATILENAIASVISEGKKVTYDLGGTAKTTEMGDAIIKRIKYGN